MPPRTRLAAKKAAASDKVGTDEAGKDAAAKAVPTENPSAAPTRIPFKNIENNQFVSASRSTASTSTSKADVEIDNLCRTTRVTSLCGDSYIRTSFNNTTLYHMPCADRNMRDFVQEKLNEDRVKLNINLSSLKNKDLYLKRIEPIIAVLCSLYKAKGTDSEEELESSFKAMTALIANAAQFKEGEWDNDEIIQLIGTLKELCPDLDADLSMIPKGKNLATGIPTRSSSQAKRFVRKKKDQLERNNKSPTIRDLVALLQNLVDFELSDNYVIIDRRGTYFKNGHEGNARYLAILRSVIQGRDPGQTLRGLVPAVLTMVEEAELQLFSYDAKTGIFSPPTDDEKIEIVYNKLKKL